MADLSIPSLLSEWDRLKLMHGISGSPAGLDRLLLGTRRRQARLRDVRDRLTRAQAEADALATEVEGMEKALRCLLNEEISRIRAAHAPAWSPQPVLGFRVWLIRDRRLHGYRVRWDHRTLQAECAATGNRPGIPHTNGECRTPPCGIYAAKDAVRVLAAHSDVPIDSMAVGLVGLAGKVVEHEAGYRGEEAAVLALTFLRQGAIHESADPEEIELLFQGVGLSDEPGSGPGSHRDAIESGIAAFLEHQKRRKMQWISESPSEL